MADRLSLEHHLFRIRGCDKTFVTVFFVVTKEQGGYDKKQTLFLLETFIFLKFYLIYETIWNRMRR